jgi:hypothetical protein
VPASLGDVPADPVGLGDVIEDEQPPLVRFARLERVDDRAGGPVPVTGADVRQSYLRAEGHQRGLDGVLLVRADPPDQVVIVGVAVGVLGGDLGLTHAAEAEQGTGRLPDDGRAAGAQVLVKCRQLRFPAREMRIPERYLGSPDAP